MTWLFRRRKLPSCACWSLIIEPAAFRLELEHGRVVLRLSGDWTAAGLGRVPSRLDASVRRLDAAARASAGLDLAALGRFDTAGALVLLRTPGLDDLAERAGREDVKRLLALARAAQRLPTPVRRLGPASALLVRIGRGVATFAENLLGGFAFLGRLIVALAALVARPWRLRAAPTVALMDRAGLDALPIVVATSFFVGATIAFLGASLLSQFGAQVFSVELVGIGVLREFGVLVTAIILAGRSGSSFAAEIGAMRMNQEIDAMRTMGVDPFEALVLPRFLAMLVMTPLLTFAAMIAGLAGGLVVVWSVIGLSPAFFVERLLENVGPQHLWLGLLKAPVMAVIIAVIGCREGLEVGGDVEQLGRRVTGAVVQSLFSIIIVDAVFALLFMELNL